LRTGQGGFRHDEDEVGEGKGEAKTDMNYPVMRILQWRELGDDEDTLSNRIVGSSMEDEAQSDHEWLCEVFKLDSSLEFDEGGITISGELNLPTGGIIGDSADRSVKITIVMEKEKESKCPKL
jgi:hypothetical protein